MVKNLAEQGLGGSLPRQVVDGIDIPQLVVLYFDKPAQQRPDLKPGERVLNEAEFRQVLERRREQRGQKAKEPGSARADGLR
jgi:hypothetical protein